MLKKLFYFFIFINSFTTFSQDENYITKTLLTDLSHPWGIDFISDDEILFTEKIGKLNYFNISSRKLKQISGLPEIYYRSQGGLSDIKISPSFKEDNKVFFSFTSLNNNGTNTLAISSAILNKENFALEDVNEIFRAVANRKTGAHYGAKILFLPDDTILISRGDGFDHREEAQYLDNHFGKLIRINKDGSIPEDNPFISNDEALNEIYSYGHRNPQGLIIGSNGNIIEHEHGPFGGDEINVIKPGKNYGWPAITYGRDYSGAIISPFTEMEGMEQPIKYWVPSIAPSGMIEYRGEAFPQWKNSLLISALKAKKVTRVDLSGDNILEEDIFAELNFRFRNLIESPNGNLILLTDGPSGKLIEVSPIKNLEVVTPDGITSFYLKNPESIVVPREPYDENADADLLITQALSKLTSKKKLLLILGGNWCPDCRVLAGMLKNNSVQALLDDNYVVEHIDVGRFDKNLHIPKRFGIEKLYGVPTVLIIDKGENVLNTPFISDWTTARAKKPEDFSFYLSKWLEG